MLATQKIRHDGLKAACELLSRYLYLPNNRINETETTMKKEADEKKTTKERIVVLEKGKASDEISTLGIPCCAAPLMPIRFW